jgi:glyoxylase-like metal-dependent hydrolase (beta-lactamase superfamily II)
VLSEPVKVERGLSGGDTFEWRGVTIRCLAAPGPTSGGLVYIVDPPEGPVAFTGDLIAGPGKLWDLYSLQGPRALPDGGSLMEYHGFLERSADVLASLRAALACHPRALVPSHGSIMRDPAAALDELDVNLRAVLQSYYRTSAGQWYFGGARKEWPAETANLKTRCRPLPAWVIDTSGTTRVLVGEDGAALVMDCADQAPRVVGELLSAGSIRKVEALWTTHYHDDHVGQVAKLVREHGCELIAHGSMVDILRRPSAYHMPCVDPTPLRPDRVTHDGDTWTWRGITLTAYTFPGQTSFDAALLARKGEESVLFVGDSLTPGGIDDYCAYNRNLVGPGRGFDYCLDLLGKLSFSGLMVNPHVRGAFAFTHAELRDLRSELARRYAALRKLVAWDEPNFALDHQWVRPYPYWQAAAPGGEVTWELHITNYASTPREATATLRPPVGWTPLHGRASSEAAAGRTICLRLSARQPKEAAGLHVATFDITLGDRLLPTFAEAVVECHPRT